MFEYYIEKFNFRLGQNHGTGILIIHLSTPHLLAEKARLVIDLMGQYYFSHKY